jgi:hypothetical protein
LHIMRDGTWEGRTIDDPAVRRLFTLDYLLKSDWYAERLRAKQQIDVALWERHTRYLRAFLAKASYAEEASRLQIDRRLKAAQKALDQAKQDSYRRRLVGTLGADPSVTLRRRAPLKRWRRSTTLAFQLNGRR